MSPLQKDEATGKLLKIGSGSLQKACCCDVKCNSAFGCSNCGSLTPDCVEVVISGLSWCGDAGLVSCDDGEDREIQDVPGPSGDLLSGTFYLRQTLTTDVDGAKDTCVWEGTAVSGDNPMWQQRRDSDGVIELNGGGFVIRVTRTSSTIEVKILGRTLPIQHPFIDADTDDMLFFTGTASVSDCDFSGVVVSNSNFSPSACDCNGDGSGRAIFAIAGYSGTVTVSACQECPSDSDVFLPCLHTSERCICWPPPCIAPNGDEVPICLEIDSYADDTFDSTSCGCDTAPATDERSQSIFQGSGEGFQVDPWTGKFIAMGIANNPTTVRRLNSVDGDGYCLWIVNNDYQVTSFDSGKEIRTGNSGGSGIGTTQTQVFRTRSFNSGLCQFVYTWNLEVRCEPNVIVWKGTKVGSANDLIGPIGTYTRISGCSTTPSSVTLSKCSSFIGSQCDCWVPPCGSLKTCYRISGYSPTFFSIDACVTGGCTPTQGTNWDGEFEDAVDGLGIVCQWQNLGARGAEDSGGTIRSLQAVAFELQFSDANPRWYMRIRCDRTSGVLVLWEGEKSASPQDTPAGVYTKISGCATGPGTLTIEECP